MESLQRSYEQETKAFSTVHYLLRTVNQFLFECSDEELEKFKKQAIENEEYDIAKRIKQEQDERRLWKERSESLNKMVAIRNKEKEELSATMNNTDINVTRENNENHAVIIPLYNEDKKDQDNKSQTVTLEDLDKRGEQKPIQLEPKIQKMESYNDTISSKVPTVPKQSKIIEKLDWDDNKYWFNIPVYNYPKKENSNEDEEKKDGRLFWSLEILSDDDETAKKELFGALKSQAEIQRKKSENLVKNHFENDVRYSMYVKEFIGYFESLCMKNNERIEQLGFQGPLDVIYQRYKSLLNLMVTEQITRGQYFDKVISMFENIEESIKQAQLWTLWDASEQLSIPK